MIIKIYLKEKEYSFGKIKTYTTEIKNYEFINLFRYDILMDTENNYVKYQNRISRILDAKEDHYHIHLNREHFIGDYKHYLISREELFKYYENYYRNKLESLLK